MLKKAVLLVTASSSDITEGFTERVDCMLAGFRIR